MAVTPAQFKTAKPQFAAVPDVTVQAYLDATAIIVDASWPASSADQATIALTCHLMTLEGLGTDAESQSQADGTWQYSDIWSGELRLRRQRDRAVAAGVSYTAWLQQTKCGQYFAILLRMTRGGPRAISIAIGVRTSGYAKDHPLHGWWAP